MNRMGDACNTCEGRQTNRWGKPCKTCRGSGGRRPA